MSETTGSVVTLGMFLLFILLLFNGWPWQRKGK